MGVYKIKKQMFLNVAFILYRKLYFVLSLTLFKLCSILINGNTFFNVHVGLLRNHLMYGMLRPRELLHELRNDVIYFSVCPYIIEHCRLTRQSCQHRSWNNEETAKITVSITATCPFKYCHTSR